MRHYPTKDYSHLTIVLSQPSRQDITQLLSGWAGEFFFRYAVNKEHTRQSVDIRTSDTIYEGLLPDTKGILLFGERAMKEWTHTGDYEKYFLGEQRGCPLEHSFGSHIPMIATYAPQDAMDVQDYEQRFNPHLKESDTNNDEEDPTDTGLQAEKQRHGITKRSNFRFWLLQDTRKICARIQANNATSQHRFRHLAKDTDKLPPGVFHIYPSALQVTQILREIKNDYLYLDIETDSNLNITCFGFSFSDKDTFVVPVLRCDYTHGYSELPAIFCALAIAMRDNIVICHNAMFDLFVLCWRYKIPIGPRVYDTMLATHRVFPEAEKSLGHTMSLWTWEPYHKDEGIFEPHTRQQEQKLWEYNGKDIRGMALVKQAIDAYVVGKPGLQASIEQANSMVRPYLINTLVGMKFSEEARQTILKENDRWMTQYLRIIEVLAGREVLPTSPKQCVQYFHEEMGYDIVGRTKTGRASTGGEYMYKLKLKYPENAIVDLILAFREKSKESGSLKFTPWLCAS